MFGMSMKASVKNKNGGENAGQQQQSGVKTHSPTSDEILASVRNHLGDDSPALIYIQKVLTLRTRSHIVTPSLKGAPVEVQHTLLGVELKVGRRRISCPDYATARYLAVFARIGCTNVAVPYDITKISSLADELESAWQRMLLYVEHLSEGRNKSFTTRVRAALIKEVREEIERAGAGTAVPQFNQNTKQRRIS